MWRALASLVALAALAACEQQDAEARAEQAACTGYELEPTDQAAQCTAFLEREGLSDVERADALSTRASLRGPEEFEAALADYDAALALNARDAGTFFQRGRLYAENDNPEAAEA